MRSSVLLAGRVAFLALVATVGSSGAQLSAPSALSVHGYLTQGYGLTGHDTVMGLTPTGTADYRRAAIVGRYAASPSDNFVVQIGHRRLGNSPTMRFEDNLKVDAAFYEHRFGFGTSIRAGKAALPSGIYNDVRYVGTLMPFYRAPYSVYAEGAYVSETIDGVVAAHTLALGNSWSLSTQAYAGDFGLLEFRTVVDSVGGASYVGAPMESKNVLGGQLWLSTPIEGLRVGYGSRRKDDYGGLFESWRALDRRMIDMTASVDANFEHWQLRAERNHIYGGNVDVQSEYIQAGISPRHWLSINAQSEFQRIDAAEPGGPMLRLDVNRDDAIGVNFGLSGGSVLKFEQHRTKGFNFEQVVNPFGPRMLGSYFIASLSTTF
jgi:hypothetical protein